MTYRYPDHLMERILDGCMSDEEWWGEHPEMPIQVSNLGRVRGVRGFVLKPYLHKGYPAVDVCGRRHVRIHTLVLEVFVGPRPDDMEACHYDNDKTNCRLMNLRWDCRSGNWDDRYREHRMRWERQRLELRGQLNQRQQIARRMAILDRLEELVT